MARGLPQAPRWAWVVIVVGVLALVVGFGYATTQTPHDPVSAQQAAAMSEAIRAADASESAASAAAQVKVVAFIGDSYTAGSGASNVDARFSDVLSKAEHWREVNVGRGGTGYVRVVEGSAAKTACGLARCPSYSEMIGQAVAGKPSIVVVSGGRNDVALADRAGYAAEVTAFYRKLRAALPGARIFAVSPVWGADQPPASLGVIGKAVQAAATSTGVTYLNIGEPLGGHPDWMAPDGIHPNDQGHQAIAVAVKRVLPAQVRG